MSDIPKRITTDKTTPGYWRVTLNNPPINAIDDRMYDEIYDLVGEIEADSSLKVVLKARTRISSSPITAWRSRAAGSARRAGSMRQPASPKAMS